MPANPGGELLKMLGEVAEKEAFGRLKLRIVEGGGRSIIEEVQKSNPTANQAAVCSSQDYLHQPMRGAGGTAGRITFSTKWNANCVRILT